MTTETLKLIKSTGKTAEQLVLDGIALFVAFNRHDSDKGIVAYLSLNDATRDRIARQYLFETPDLPDGVDVEIERRHDITRSNFWFE